MVTEIVIHRDNHVIMRKATEINVYYNGTIWF